jgi:DnaJ-class molecular chaperone
MPPADPYVVLGVARAASAGELRRAYRLLALRHHPDRAGAQSTETFQRIADAYRTLSDPQARAAYDRDEAPAPGDRRPNGAGRPGSGGEHASAGGRISWRTRAEPQGPRGRPIERLCGPLDQLVASAAARQREGNLVELLLTAREAAAGGAACIDVSLRVTCPTCFGHAAPDQLWCRRCEHAGTVMDTVTVVVEIAAAAVDGTTFTFAADPGGREPPLRVRLRVTD